MESVLQWENKITARRDQRGTMPDPLIMNINVSEMSSLECLPILNAWFARGLVVIGKLFIMTVFFSAAQTFCKCVRNDNAVA